MDKESNSTITKVPADKLKVKDRRKSKAFNVGQGLLFSLQGSSILSSDLTNSISGIQKKKNGRRCSQFINNNLSFNSFHINDSVTSALENINEMRIEQIPDILEAVCSCCCQLPNTYRCYAKTEDNLVEYFLCKEFSGQCMRLICPVNYREFTMNGKFTYNNKGNYKNSFLKMSKPLRCPCLCLCRPEFEIEYLNSLNQYEKIGTICSEYSVCDPIFVIYDHDGEEIFYIEADCCQAGFMCRNNVFGKTDEAHFFIYDYNNRDEVIGDICKQSASSYHSIADDFSLNFPIKATVKQKLLLMLTAIMIDYQFYEKNDISYK